MLFGEAFSIIRYFDFTVWRNISHSTTCYNAPFHFIFVHMFDNVTYNEALLRLKTFIFERKVNVGKTKNHQRLIDTARSNNGKMGELK